MTKPRDGYRNVFTQLTVGAWAALARDADSRGQSMITRLNEVLHQHYRIPKSKIPAPKRTGRRPKQEK